MRVETALSSVRSDEVRSPYNRRNVIASMVGYSLVSLLSALMYLPNTQEEGENQLGLFGAVYASMNILFVATVVAFFSLIQITEAFSGGDTRLWKWSILLGFVIPLPFFGLNAVGVSGDENVELLYMKFKTNSEASWGVAFFLMMLHVPISTFSAFLFFSNIKQQLPKLMMLAGSKLYIERRMVEDHFKVYRRELRSNDNRFSHIEEVKKAGSNQEVLDKIFGFSSPKLSSGASYYAMDLLFSVLFLSMVYARVGLIAQTFETVKQVPYVRSLADYGYWGEVGLTSIASMLTIISGMGFIGYAWLGVNVLLDFPSILKQPAFFRSSVGRVFASVAWSALFTAYSDLLSGVATRESLSKHPFFNPLAVQLIGSVQINVPLVAFVLLELRKKALCQFGNDEDRQLIDFDNKISALSHEIALLPEEELREVIAGSDGAKFVFPQGFFKKPSSEESERGYLLPFQRAGDSGKVSQARI